MEFDAPTGEPDANPTADATPEFVDLGAPAPIFADPDGPPPSGVRDVQVPLPTNGLPKRLSPSSASTFQQCPKRWKMRYVDRLPDPPGQAALAGTFAHLVLEHLLQEDPADRSIDRAKVLAREHWPEIEADEGFVGLGLSDDEARHFRWVSWKAIEGLWTLEKPESVNVEATEQLIDAEVGGVPFRGIVDRLDREPDGLVVSDYKSGKAPRPRYVQAKLSQVLLYAAAIGEQLGVRPKRARLLYLGQRTIETDVTEGAVETVVDELAATWADMNTSCESDTFKASTGPLCGWCPFADRCEEGQAEIRSRLQQGRIRLDAPALELLGESVLAPTG